MKTKTKLTILGIGFLLLSCQSVLAAKLVEVKVVDKDYLMVSFKDGDVEFVDDGLGTDAFTSAHQTGNNYVVAYGDALNTSNAANVNNWILKSVDDPLFGSTGLSPVNSYRKSKINGLAEMDWNSGAGDWNYEYTMEHQIFLKMGQSMTNGATYTLEINSNTNTDVTSETFAYNFFNSRSEAIHINLVGYYADSSIKAADLYMWMGDGGARDYTSFEGNTVYIYDVSTQQSFPVGTVTFGSDRARETDGRYMIQSDVWRADFTGFSTPGTYRIVIEGIGCSEDFEISNDVFFEPFRVSTLGFFYMRIGQDDLGMTPVPRRPLYLPETSPSATKVIVTDMSPYHPDWANYSGDNWDSPSFFSGYVKAGSPENPAAYGGHSDALDWDRHLGHVSIIYDMLLPYILTDGALTSDELGIAESGNGIPDLLDEARNEVDFWLRLRYEGGYSHGVTNPSGNTLYQADNTPIAAWANAANAAMLADAFRIAGMSALMNQYRDAAIEAYNYASALPDQMLDTKHEAGTCIFRGRDLKMMAAAYLYNVTGNTTYEDVINAQTLVTGPASDFISSSSYNQLYANAAYIKTNQPVHYQALHNNMISAAVYQAKLKEANYSTTRPSRRSIDNSTGWFHTEQHVQRTILAHAVATDPADKTFFKDALILEADWSLGRNSANVIQMTTATTALGSKRSVQQAYTSGWDDGSPGVHPGHTPYMNLEDWGGTMAMGRPAWLTSKGYPAISNWPASEAYYDVRYIYAHSEFTPQQTMRGKQALYGYLSAIGEPAGPPVAVTGVSLSPAGVIINGAETIPLIATVEPPDATNRFVMWGSSNENIAKVDAGGMVTGAAIGSAVITATTLDGNYTDTSDITVNDVEVSGISVTPSTISMQIGSRDTVSADVLPVAALDKTVTWSSDDTSIAMVDENGIISGVAAGTATISATTQQGGYSDSCQVTVEELPGSIVIYRDAGGIAYWVWPGGDDANAYKKTELTSGGQEGLRQYRYDYDFSNWWDGMGFNFDPVDISQLENLVIAVNGPSSPSNYIYIRISDTNGVFSDIYDLARTTSYSLIEIPIGNLKGSSAVDLTSIDHIMISVTGTQTGSGTFYVDNVYFGSTIPHVPVTGVTVNPTSVAIDGKTMQLTAVVSPPTATNKGVTWRSSNPSTASVSSFGMVMGHAVGTATITVSTEEGDFAASTTVNVTTPTRRRVLKVMPLGDSITEGYTIPGGYRLQLWQNLEDADLDCGVDFVGTLDHHWAVGLGDPDHEGHSGWTTGDILASIDSYLAYATPDIVIMHLGTNDMAMDVVGEAPNNVRGLIDRITAVLPADGKLYVAQIIPIGGMGNEESVAYNEMIVTAVTEKRNQGRPVYLVDAYSIWSNDLYVGDWTHPSQQGYNVMGDFWFNVIKDDVQLRCGDVNGDGLADLADAISALKVLASSTTAVVKGADVNGDGRIGFEEVLHILKNESTAP